MLRGGGLTSKVLKIGKRWLDDKESAFFTTKKKEGTKNALSKCIEINKAILKNENILEIVKIIKKNERNANIINYVTFVHRLMQIICSGKDDSNYLKGVTYIHDEIEEKINIIFQYFIDHKKSAKVNNYNKRLFSSFIWSLSKYASLFRGGDTRFFFASTVPQSSLALPCKGEGEWLKRALVLNGQGEHSSGVHSVCLSGWDNSNGMVRSTPLQTTSHQGEQNRSDGKNGSCESVRGTPPPCNKFNLLCYYADAYLPSLNPSRYVLVLWSLSKLNKHFKELHERYYERSTNLIPLLKSREVIMLLYSYSHVNYSNLHFYVKVKDFIMSRNAHRQMVRAGEHESVVNMLLSFSRQNVFPQDLLEGTVDQILHSKGFLKSIKSKDLITLLFCLCKCPFLYTPVETPFEVLKKREKNTWARKNILLYEWLKREIMNRCWKGRSPCGDTFQTEGKNTREEVPLQMGTYSLENLILIIWSLSLKHIYSAELLLCCFAKLSDYLKNENCVNGSYPMLTNFYLSLLSFLLEDGTVINLYFNRAELNALRVLHNHVGTFENHFGTFKKAINMNGRKHDVEVSGMQKVIYNLVSNLFKGSEKVAVLLEHKNVVNLSVDILLLQREKEHRGVPPRGEFLREEVSSHGEKRNEQAYHSDEGAANCAGCATGKSNAAIGSPFVITPKRTSLGAHQKCNYHSCAETDNIKSGTYTEETPNVSAPIEKADIPSDEVRSSLLNFIERTKHASDKMDGKELKKIFKEVLTFFGKYFTHMNDQEIVSFFYKFSALFPRLCELRDRGRMVIDGGEDFLRIFSHFHGYTINTFFQNVNKRKTHHLLDVCWVYFRYMKCFCSLSKGGNSDGDRDRESVAGMATKKRLSGEIKKIVDLFDHVVMNKMINEQMIAKMSSKNMAHLISIFLHLNNSSMIGYLKKKNFHNVHFSVKDILLILSALAKSHFEWKTERSYFCNKFIEHIDTCGVRDLVEFTHLCAELKWSSEPISTHIKDKVNSCVPLQPLTKQPFVERRSNCYGGGAAVSSPPSGQTRQTKFIETFEQDELALFVRNCYRMHCFDRHFFDTLCDSALRRRSTLSVKSLCILLPCFARVYCLHGVGAHFASGRSGGRESLMGSGHPSKIGHTAQLAHPSDHLDADISSCRYDVPASLKKLAKHAEAKVLSSRNPNLFNLAYFMEAITLLKVENKKAYDLCMKEVERKVGMGIQIGGTNGERKRQSWGDTDEAKLLGKILWCMSYYHKTEFTLARKITNFLLTRRIYQNVSPENFISIFLYYIKSRVYNRRLFHEMGQAVTTSITLRDYFVGGEGRQRGGFKLSVITELFGTMAWAYAFTCCYAHQVEDSSTNRGEKREEKNIRQKSEEKNDQLLLNKIYSFLLNEIKTLHKYKGVSFLLLARYLWGVAIVNLVNEEVAHFINTYNWDAVRVREQNDMHLHMIVTFWLRLKYSHHGFHLCEDFLTLKDRIMCQLGKKKKELKNGHHAASEKMSDFHQQVCQVLDKFGVKYENEHMAQELLSIDLAIRDEAEGERIAVEVDGPSHHLVVLDETDPRAKKMYAPCGTTHFKNWLLRKMGWTVINIEAHKWNKLRKEEKDAYVVGKLTSCSESLNNHFAKWVSPN